MKTFVFAALIAILCASATAQTQCEASLYGFRIHRVYVVGTQYNGVVWAYKHLAEATCITPVLNPSQADAILEIVPASASAQENGPLTVTCTSTPGSSLCLDSDGNEMSSSCNGGVCSSYYGPSIGAAILGGLHQWIVNAWYNSNARLYTLDHKILWKSEDQKRQALLRPLARSSS